VFRIGGDPVKAGLVGRFSRPGDNVMGVTLGKASALLSDGRAGGKSRLRPLTAGVARARRYYMVGRNLIIILLPST